MSTGSLSPATYPTDAITIRCDRCSRVGRYRRQSLIERYGRNVAMPDVLNEITACERNARLSTERCEAYMTTQTTCRTSKARHRNVHAVSGAAPAVNRRATGGSIQRFCKTTCRRSFHNAARIWTEREIAEGRLTVEELRVVL